MAQPETILPSRQHHFDALRGFAMLLGIGLHAALSFTGTPWLVMDDASSRWLKWLFEAIHGFRMQLFFLVSGYFTMLLFRRRGLNPLLEQRFQRVLVPCLLGLFTVLPLQQWIVLRAADTAPRKAPPVPASKMPLVEEIRERDAVEVERLIANGAEPDRPDPEFGIPPLGWAALYGDRRIAELLLDRGADVSAKDRDGYRPLHQAAFLGRVEVVRLLLQRGADAAVRGKNKDTPRESAAADWRATQFIAGFLRVPIGAERDVRAGRDACIEAIDLHESQRGDPFPFWEALEANHKDLQQSYRAFLTSPRWSIRMNPQGPPFHAIFSPEFGHLWFLWFLCWFVVLFAVAAKVFQYLPIPRLPGWLILSRFRILWLVPSTMIPQLFMGVFGAGFGPDTSIGVIPQPHLLVYYGLFFCVGLLYHDCDDRGGRLGRWWWMWLILAGGLFFLAQTLERDPLSFGLIQVCFAWTMIFGILGLFRRVLGREYRFVRYLSDSAYWLYLVHLPLVIYMQAVVREWEYSAPAKFAGICVSATAVLLLSYQIFVRHTYLGTILNGPRARNLPVVESKSPAG